MGPIEARPSMVSKLNTLCQVAFILAVIGREEFSMPAGLVVLMLGALTFVTIVVSGIDYVLRYGRRASQEAKSRRAVACRRIEAHVRQLTLGVSLRADAVFASFAPGGTRNSLRAREDRAAIRSGCGGVAVAVRRICCRPCARRPAAAVDRSRPPAAYFPLDRSLALPPEALTGFEKLPRALRG